MTTKTTNGRTGTESDVTVDLEDAPPLPESEREEDTDQVSVVKGETDQAPSDAPAADGAGALQARIADLEEKNKITYERLLRTTADLENFRKRTRREIDDARTDARGKVLLEMLPVIDNLERAVQHSSAAVGESKGIAEGVELVLRQFYQALERCDVKSLDVVGKPFDPNFHEAVGQRESAEHPPGTAVEVLQRGYTIGQRLLRPALVVVSKAAAGAVAEGAGAAGAEGTAASPAADEEG